MPSRAFPVTPPGIRVRTTADRLVKLFPVLPITKQGIPGLRIYASLEPCLTVTLLRFANTSPPSGCIEDFHLQVADMIGTQEKWRAFLCNRSPYYLRRFYLPINAGTY